MTMHPMYPFFDALPGWCSILLRLVARTIPNATSLQLCFNIFWYATLDTDPVHSADIGLCEQRCLVILSSAAQRSTRRTYPLPCRNPTPLRVNNGNYAVEVCCCTCLDAIRVSFHLIEHRVDISVYSSILSER